MRTVRCPYDDLIFPVDGPHGFAVHIVKSHASSPEYRAIREAIDQHAELVAAELRREAIRSIG